MRVRSRDSDSLSSAIIAGGGSVCERESKREVIEWENLGKGLGFRVLFQYKEVE